MVHEEQWWTSYNVCWTQLHARVVTDRGLGPILHDELHWLDVPDRVFFKLVVTVHRCLNDHAPAYLSDCCVAVTGADTRRHLRSVNRQLLAVPHFQINTCLSRCWPHGLELSPKFTPRDMTSIQTASDVYLKRICSRDTSAFSMLEVLDDNSAI